MISLIISPSSFFKDCESGCEGKSAAQLLTKVFRKQNFIVLTLKLLHSAPLAHVLDKKCHVIFSGAASCGRALQEMVMFLFFFVDPVPDSDQSSCVKTLRQLQTNQPVAAENEPVWFYGRQELFIAVRQRPGRREGKGGRGRPGVISSWLRPNIRLIRVQLQFCLGVVAKSVSAWSCHMQLTEQRFV